MDHHMISKEQKRLNKIVFISIGTFSSIVLFFIPELFVVDDDANTMSLILHVVETIKRIGGFRICNWLNYSNLIVIIMQFESWLVLSPINSIEITTICR